MKVGTKKIIITICSVVLAIAMVIGGFNIYFAVINGIEKVGESEGYAWTEEDSFDTFKSKKLEMGADDFKILIMTDIHLKNKGTFAKFLGINFILDWTSKSAIDKLVKSTEPDLIIILGDTTLTDRNDIEYERFVKMMDSYKLPWACVFGNHDDEGRADKAKLVDVLKTSDYGLFEYGPEDLHGAGNYVLELVREGRTEYALFLMDSGSSNEFKDKTEGVNIKQIDWYEWNMRAISENNGGEIPNNMAFFHIPLPQYNDIMNYEQGERNEKTFSENSKGDFLTSFIENNGSHIFVGHDHNNNFIADFQGVKLSYATKSSYNCYFKGGLTGGTLITIDKNLNIKEEIKYF